MKTGSGKQKGSAFERKVCKQLSLWVSHGKKEDLFWRSAMSGGRATVARSRGRDVRQAGDITAVAPEGHELTNAAYIECKHYRDLALTAFVLEGRGTLAKFWFRTRDEALKRQKFPWLVAKQNRLPTLLLVPYVIRTKAAPACVIHIGDERVGIFLFDEFLKVKFSPWSNEHD